MEDNKRPKFGNRKLEDEAAIFTQNAWDNVDWDEEFKNDVAAKIALNSQNKVAEDQALELETNASGYWNKFYDQHDNKFFKDRHWILTEFPELSPEKDKKKTILELGCGVGNTVFPLLEIDSYDSLYFYCCDFSEIAIEIVKQNPLYNENKCKAFVFDITSDNWDLSPLKPESLDMITMIFVLSAIDSKFHLKVIKNLIPFLKSNGMILFRDYGQYDMAQIRFGNGKCIKERFYVRGDGTRAYFFQENEVENLFIDAGLTKLDLHVDRRLQVNRANKKKMYRVWIQARFVKKF